MKSKPSERELGVVKIKQHGDHIYIIEDVVTHRFIDHGSVFMIHRIASDGVEEIIYIPSISFEYARSNPVDKKETA